MKILDQRLIKNAVKCLECNTIAESTHRHHMASCECGAVSADGGLDYEKRSWKTGSRYESVSEYEEYYREEYGFGLDDGKIEWLKENKFPEDGNWYDDQKVLYKLRWG